MFRAARLLVVIGLAFMCACGNDSGTSPSPVTPSPPSPPPGPSRAQITLEVINFGVLATESAGSLFFVEIKLQETAGLGANINFLRLEVFRATGEREEAQEIGANDIVGALGSNRLGAGTTWQESVVFYFRATIKAGRQLRLTVGLTDDRGNNFELFEDFVFMR